MVQSMEATEARKRLLIVSEQKTAVEARLKALQEQLVQQGVTSQTRLVDSQGFPRADIDVYNIRNTRVKIIELQNDLKSQESQLAELLQRYHGEVTRVVSPQSPTAASDARPGTVAPVHSINASISRQSDASDFRTASLPFARVVSVAPNSPAMAAELQKDDLIMSFDTINQSISEPLKKLPAIVAAKENVAIEVLVTRAGAEKVLFLTPRTWEGRGLLGCHIVPC